MVADDQDQKYRFVTRLFFFNYTTYSVFQRNKFYPRVSLEHANFLKEISLRPHTETLPSASNDGSNPTKTILD